MRLLVPSLVLLAARALRPPDPPPFQFSGIVAGRGARAVEIQPAADGHSLSAASTGSASAACEKKSSMGRENEPRNPPRPGEKACPAPPCGAASLTTSSLCFDTLEGTDFKPY